MERDELVSAYYQLGFQQREILFCLAQRHGIILSSRTLKRVLKRHRLYRKKHWSDLLEVAFFIEKELRECGELHGYRWMHCKCIQSGLVVSQENVRLLLHILDPEGIASRRARRLRRRRYTSRGPNWVWHVDGYDKLKPYGIAINGCVDGFSRYVLWLEAYNSNSNPTLIAGYFMKTVLLRSGCPVIVRADRGTENGHMEVMQKLMRCEQDGPDAAGSRSFIYGRSVANQRIESWWAMFRKQCSQHWINVFSELRDEGAFSADFLDKNLICFCFLKLVQVRR